jgi:hypothetical protein
VSVIDEVNQEFWAEIVLWNFATHNYIACSDPLVYSPDEKRRDFGFYVDNRRCSYK